MIYNILIKDSIFLYFLISFFSYKYFEKYYSSCLFIILIFTVNHNWKVILDVTANHTLFSVLLVSLLESNLLSLVSFIFLVLLLNRKNLIMNIYMFKKIFLFIYLYILFLIFEKIELDIAQYLNYNLLDRLDLKTDLLNGIFFFHPLMFLISTIIMLNLVVFYSFKKNIKTYYNKNLDNIIRNNIYIGNNLFLFFIILSSSVITGSWWAQQELNWNGWWSWDIIELISLVQLILVIASFHKYMYTINYLTLKRISLIFFISFLALRFHIIITRHTFLIDENLIQNIVYGIIAIAYLAKRLNLKIISKPRFSISYFDILIYNLQQNKRCKFNYMIRQINISIITLIYNFFEISILIIFLTIIIGNFLKLTFYYIPTTILMININLVFNILSLTLLFIILLQSLTTIRCLKLTSFKILKLISFTLLLDIILLNFQKNIKTKFNLKINVKVLHLLFLSIIIFFYIHPLIFNVSFLFISSCDLYLKTNIFSLNFFSKINTYYQILDKNNKSFISFERVVWNKTIFLTKEIINNSSFQNLFGRFNHISEYIVLNNLISFKNSLGLELFLNDLYFLYFFFLIVFFYLVLVS